MSFLFGGGSKIKPEYTGINTQTSSSVVPLPLTWGQCRIAPNLMDYVDFQAHKVKAGGKGFGGVTSYTYSATIVMGLSEGPIGGIINIWKDSSSQETTTLSKLGFTLFTGTIPQSPWGYMTANHPDHARNYAGIAYVAAPNYNLGQSASTPQHSFELKARQWSTGVNSTVVDADPAIVVDEYLTRAIVGCNYPTSSIDYTSLYSTSAATTTGDATLQTYCRAMGFAMSPALTSQEDGGTILDRWCRILNIASVFDGYQLTFVPYAYAPITANGVTFLPQTASDYSLTDDDYVSQGKGADPVLIKREPIEFAKNQLYFECLDRNNQYNPVPVAWVDQALVDRFGPLPDSTFNAHEICDLTMAGKMATLMGERGAFERNEFTFYLSPVFSLLKPTSLLNVYDPLFGTVQIRVDKIDEQDSGDFKITGKMVVTQGNTPGFTAGAVTPTTTNAGATASNVNTPMIFQPPSALTNHVPQVWATLCGGGGTYDANWGGCDIYVSTDAGTSYNKIGTYPSPARMGVLAAALAAYGGAAPDTTDTLKVDVSQSGASFVGSTAADAAAGVTLCRIAPDGANTEEYVAYQNATLNSANNYWFDHLYRGLYGSVAGAHGVGAQFARLDSDLVFKYNYPTSLVGTTIHFKFVSFNIYGGGYQDISTVTDYTYAIANVDYGTVVATSGTATPANGNTLQYNSTTGQWVPVASTSPTVTATATEALADGDLVYLYNNSGAFSVRRADAAAGYEAHGFVKAAVASGATATVYGPGINDHSTGLTAGVQYLSDSSPGKTTVTPPSTGGHLVQEVGMASSATSYIFEPRPSVGLT